MVFRLHGSHKAAQICAAFNSDSSVFTRVRKFAHPFMLSDRQRTKRNRFFSRGFHMINFAQSSFTTAESSRPDQSPSPACHLSVCRAGLGVSRKMERRFPMNVSLKTRSLTAPRRSSSNSCSGKSSGRVTSLPLGHEEERISICPSFLTHNRSIRQSLISALANSFA
jgi:hypothetical protein